MNKPPDNHQFWSGFAFGTLAGTALLYFFATSKGREQIRKYLSHADVLEKDITGVFDLLKEFSSLPGEKQNTT